MWVAASLIFGLSVWIAAQSAMGMAVPSSRRKNEDTYDYVKLRLAKIREADGGYRFMERFVLELAPYFRTTAKTDIVRQAIPHMKSGLPWHPEEYRERLPFVGVSHQR